MRIFSISSGLAILGIIGVSVHFFAREYSAVLFNAQTSTSQISRISNNMLATPASYRAKLDLLVSCDRTMSSLGFGLLVSDNRNSIRENCNALAQRILTASPDLAYAHYISALSASNDPRSEQFSDALVASVTHGEFVQWQAERRLPLAMKHFDAAPKAATLAITNGVDNLIRYPAGRAILIQMYRAYATTESASWEQATVAIEQTPAEYQKRFIFALQASLAN